MDNVKVNLPKRFNCIYVYSRSTHNINDVFEPFVSTFNNVPMITRAGPHPLCSPGPEGAGPQN
jgi:hypothetical protein